MIFVFDLEGPLSPMDHAAEAMRVIGEKLGRPDFFDLFQMLSLYDDELTIEGKPGYNPGDTLRLIAPIVSTSLSDEELSGISKTATLTPGAKDLMATLDLNDVYVASTSYQQHAHVIAAQLGIPEENVNCTRLPGYSEFPYMPHLEAIFEKYKRAGGASPPGSMTGGMRAVKADLDALFWAEMDPTFLRTKVCGGERKMEVVERISSERGVDIRDFMAVGDSITDINMLGGVKKEGGIAVSFNGNQFSVPTANLAVSALSLMALRPIIDAQPGVWDFVREWNSTQDKYSLLDPDTRDYFKSHNLRARYDEVRGPRVDAIVAAQKEMRAAIRKEYAVLG